MLARVLAAVTSAVYTPQVAATVSMLVPESERATVAREADDRLGRRLGARQSAVGAGCFDFDWRASFAFIGIASGIVAFLVWRCVPAKVEVPPLNWVRWFRCCARRRCAG
jgi:predicted MFS family arabinose efflux permease